MKKICHLTSAHKRTDGRIFIKECKSLHKAGYDVSLIVADGKGDEIVDGIRIYDVGKANGRLDRFVNLNKKIYNKAFELDCDIYHFHDPDLIFTGLKLKKRKKKVIFDMHEDNPGYISELSYIPKLFRKTVSNLYETLEIYAVKKFDGIVSTRQIINDRLAKYNSNIVLITNFPIIKEEIDTSIREDKIICFAGAIIDSWRHKEIINAIDKIDNVRYLLAGPVSELYLKELQSLNGWSKVEYLGLISHAEVEEMYKRATLGIAIYVYCKNMGGREGNLANTKMFEFMNYGLPFICTDFRIWKQIVEVEEKCGICVNPYNEEEIKDAIEFLIDNPDKSRKMGENARKAAISKYNWAIQELKLVAFYNKVIYQ